MKLLAVMLGVLAMAPAVVLVGARPASAQLAPDTIVIEGRGWGHGNGMSQWGALGYAVDHDWSSAQIVDHFYGNTYADTVPDDDITVHLRANDQRPLRLTSQRPFRVAKHGFDAGEVVRVQTTGRSTFSIHRNAPCGSIGVEVANEQGQRAGNGDYYIEALAEANDPVQDDIEAMLQVIYCDREHPETESSRVAYRGRVGAVSQGSNTYAFVRLPLEQYLRAVVPRESPNHWGEEGHGQGIAALEAQAITARSWTLNLATHRRARGYFTDTCDTTACQTFGGSARNGRPLDFGTGYIFSNTAIANTAGLVRRYDDTDEIAFTEYSSSSGGWTAGLDEGSRFPAVEDLGDHSGVNPNHVWRTTIRRADVEAAYPSVGALIGIEVTGRNGNGEWGGRTRAMTIHGTEGTVDLSWGRWAHDTFRRTFSLRSDWYRFPQFTDGYEFLNPADVVPDPDGDPDGDPASGPDDEPDDEPDGDPDSDPDRQPIDRRPPIADGMWVLKDDGTIQAHGDARFYGDMSAAELAAPMVGIAAHPDGRGYWLTASDGGVFAFGSAGFYGSMGGQPLDEPVVGIAAHPSGNGYWLVASDGGIFSFGAAPFHGSTGGMPLDEPVNGMAPTSSGGGYWMVAHDGGVFSFGDAVFFGSVGGGQAEHEVVEMVTTDDGSGYWLLNASSGVHLFGTAVDWGSRAARENRLTATAMARTQSGEGYWIVWTDGTSFPYGDAQDYITSAAGEGVVAVASVP